MIHENVTMADHLLITALEVCFVKPTAYTEATTTSDSAAEERIRKSGKSTSKKNKSSNNNDSESKNSKPEPNPKPKPTSYPTVALESDSSIIPVPLPALTNATPSAEGLSLTMNTKTLTTVATAATTKIMFSFPPTSQRCPPLPLIQGRDEGQGGHDDGSGCRD